VAFIADPKVGLNADLRFVTDATNPFMKMEGGSIGENG
jgi:hypothetical protein